MKKEKIKDGASTKYKEEYNEQARKLCLLGANDAELGYFFGVAENTIIEWILTIPSFCDSIIKAKEQYPAYLQAKEEKKAKRREYRKSDNIRKQQREYKLNLIKTVPKEKVRANFTSLMRSRLKSKSLGIFSNLPYTIGELMTHLERKFVKLMSWDNYGRVWHIDHKKPDRLFNYQSQEDKEFQECWALSNLQPLFAKDNLKKGGKYAGT